MTQRPPAGSSATTTPIYLPHLGWTQGFPCLTSTVTELFPQPKPHLNISVVSQQCHCEHENIFQTHGPLGDTQDPNNIAVLTSRTLEAKVPLELAREKQGAVRGFEYRLLSPFWTGSCTCPGLSTVALTTCTALPLPSLLLRTLSGSHVVSMWPLKFSTD